MVAVMVAAALSGAHSASASPPTNSDSFPTCAPKTIDTSGCLRISANARVSLSSSSVVDRGVLTVTEEGVGPECSYDQAVPDCWSPRAQTVVRLANPVAGHPLSLTPAPGLASCASYVVSCSFKVYYTDDTGVHPSPWVVVEGSVDYITSAPPPAGTYYEPWRGGPGYKWTATSEAAFRIVSLNPPTATFSTVQDDHDPFTFNFDGSNSLAQSTGSSITGWAWDFGDGTAGSGPRVTHRYATAGHFPVKLTVTDSNGQTGTYAVPADVSPLVVRLDPGTTNGKVFSVDVSVRNAGSTPISGLRFDEAGGIVSDPSVAVPGSSGAVTETDGPLPDLPASLTPGQTATSTATFSVDRQGGLDLVSRVTGTDGASAVQHGMATAIVQIGKRAMTDAQVQAIYADILTGASRTVGGQVIALQQRLGALMAYASTHAAAGGLPAWLTAPISAGTTAPTGSALPEVAGWKILAARSAGLDDRALAWLPDDPLIGLKAYANFEAHVAQSSAKVVGGTVRGAGSALQNAASFYGQLSSGDEAFRAEATRQLSGLVSDAGAAAASKITVIGALLAASNDDPGQLGDYTRSPVLQQFVKDSNATIDASLQSSSAKLGAYVQKTKVDPVGAAGDVGDVVGETTTGFARDTALAEFGGPAISRLGKVVEGVLPFARTGTSLAGTEALLADRSTAALVGTTEATGQQIVRQTLESLGSGSELSLAQLEQLGGFYGADAPKVQKIINEINGKYKVNLEVHVRPGNPASLPYYKNGTGVPKPEWIKPKATEWTDVVLGAPENTLGKATLYEPKRPPAAELAKFGQAERQAIEDRFATQQELYKKSLDPAGDFQKLLSDSQTAEGATVRVAHGTKDITGLKYKLEPVEGHPGAFVVKDEAAGGKFVLSDADYQAVVDAKTNSHLGAADQRGKIEQEFMYRLEHETASFGGHGWSHSGFDLASKYSEPFIKFATGSMSLTEARATLNWFVQKGPLPGWLQKIADKIPGGLTGNKLQAALVDKLVEEFRPGQFVIKFNGTDMRVGFSAGLGK